MKILILILCIVASSMAFADMSKAPTNFKYKDSLATFIDVVTIDSKLVFDLDTEKVIATSIIEFEMGSEGYPIFDLRSKILSVEINGAKTTAKEINDPDQKTTYRIIGKKLSAGTHRIEVTNLVETNIRFKRDSVSSAFWMSDLADRKYIEQYLPSNIEYDQYQLTMNIEIKAQSSQQHKVYTNGSLSSSAKNNFKIVFPEYFTASSFYFHLTPHDKFKEIEFTFDSISGETIPVIAYTGSIFQSLNKVKRQTLKILKELEAKFGAWSHPSLTIYIAGQGGMEHSGATITSMSALGHELTHSYFARGVMPIDGNAGWMDEAIASWRDKGYKAVRTPNFSSSQMSAHSQYKRSTDTKAYSQGADFMAFLNKRLEDQGGLTSFLATIYEKYSHASISTEMFKKDLEIFTGEDFSSEFSKYIYGSKALNKTRLEQTKSNPYHLQQTKEQLLNLL